MSGNMDREMFLSAEAHDDDNSDNNDNNNNANCNSLMKLVLYLYISHHRRRPCNINAKDSKGNTPLHLATKSNIISCLIENGAEVDAVNDLNETPFMKNISRFDFETIRFYLNNGANINHQNSYGDTVLHIAATNGAMQLVKFLIEDPQDDKQQRNRIININIQNMYGDTAIHIAAKRKYFSIMNFLLKQDSFDVNIKNDDGDTVNDLCCM